MSINRLPSIDDYWSCNPNTRYHPVADRITRDGFRDMQRYLHFVDNSSIIPRGQPMQPTKRGIKVWVLADAHNGYFTNFSVYTGKFTRTNTYNSINLPVQARKERSQRKVLVDEW